MKFVSQGWLVQWGWESNKYQSPCGEEKQLKEVSPPLPPVAFICFIESHTWRSVRVTGPTSAPITPTADGNSVPLWTPLPASLASLCAPPAVLPASLAPLCALLAPMPAPLAPMPAAQVPTLVLDLSGWRVEKGAGKWHILIWMNRVHNHWLYLNYVYFASVYE